MARLTRNRAGTILACLAAAAGCEADPEPPPLSHHARDSAGIAIAVNSGAPAGAERWSVDDELGVAHVQLRRLARAGAVEPGRAG